MDKNEINDDIQFLVTTYKDCLMNGLKESPSQFLMRMNVEPEVEKNVRPLLEKEEKLYGK